jgi:hypothetical protein
MIDISEIDLVGICQRSISGAETGNDAVEVLGLIQLERSRGAAERHGPTGRHSRYNFESRAGVARFSDWFPTKQKFDSFVAYVDASWGIGESYLAFAPSKGDIEFKRWWGRWERFGGSPSAVISLMQMNSGINIDGILPSPIDT